MSRVVTGHYLRRRFWVATLILLATLAASAGVAVLTLRAQEVKSDYAIAMQGLGHAVNRLDVALDRLASQSRRGGVSRDAARAEFLALLTEFHGIVIVTGESQQLNPRAGGLAVHDHLEDLAAEFGIDEAEAVARRHLVAGRMPEGLARIWEPERSVRGAPRTGNLEFVLARVLRLAGDIVRSDGPLTQAETRGIQQIHATIVSDVSPRLEEITVVLDAKMHESFSRALLSIFALLGTAGVAALFIGFTIFRPLERAVITAQDGLTAERDRAIEVAAAKRDFLSQMSHELRTPMNGVLGFASLLLASDLRSEQRRQAEIIRTSGRTLLALINDILELSRMEAGLLQIADEPYGLEEVIAEVLTLASACPSGKDLDTAVYVDPALPERIRGDRERVRQILTNLVGNALKFTGRGTVTVEARRIHAQGGAAGLELAVSDTGPGIPPDQQERIFERFTRVAGTTRPGTEEPGTEETGTEETGAENAGTEGTGLGLAICRELVERMGGSIRVESEPGSGTTFRVCLPLADTEASPGTPHRAAPLAPLQGWRVLVVNENTVAARLVCRQLEGWGLTADHAPHGDDAWRLLGAAAEAGAPYRLMIAGRLPAGEGPAALVRRIRGDARFGGLRVALAADTGSEAAAGATAAGFDAVAEPPLMPRALSGMLAWLAGGDRQTPAPGPGTGPKPGPGVAAPNVPDTHGSAEPAGRAPTPGEVRLTLAS